MHKKMLAALLLLIFIPFSALSATYSDTEGHWAVNSIKKATTMHLAAGYEDGTFRPDGEVTRAEFIAFANRTFNIFNIFEPAETSQFSDVQKSDWFYEQILIAQAAGYLSIYGDGEMAPNTPINRQEAGALLSQLLTIQDNLEAARINTFEKGIEKVMPAVDPHEDKDAATTDDRQNTSSTALPFTDQDRITNSYLPYIADLTARNLIAGYPDGSFRPTKTITRGEAIVLLLRSAGKMAESANVENSALTEEDGKIYLKDHGEQGKDGLVLVDGKYYLLGEDSTVENGWVERNGHKYYSEMPDGLVRGWKQIDDALYYFSPTDCTLYTGGIKSTGQGAYWFADDGKLQTGLRPGGYRGKLISWRGPSDAELSNAALNNQHAERIAKGQAIVNFATQFEGVPFKWFGCDLKDPTGIYCCGASYSVYHEAGIAIPGPNDCDMYADNGYRMVKEQYLRAEEFGGQYVPTDFDTLWPGDLSYSRSLKHTYGYNHVAIFMGKNGGRPVIAHATLADGFVIEPTNILTTGWTYAYLNSVRYV